MAHPRSDVGHRVNIGSEHQSDVFFRYKRPTASLAQRRKGTVLLNLEEIALACNRSPRILAAFFRRVFSSARVSLHETTGHLAFTRKLHKEDVEDELHRFCDAYCLCRTCGLPETNWTIDRRRGKRSLLATCQACGAHHAIEAGAHTRKPEEKFICDVIHLAVSCENELNPVRDEFSALADPIGVTVDLFADERAPMSEAERETNDSDEAQQHDAARQGDAGSDQESQKPETT